MSFDSLHPVVQHHVVNSLGWSNMRPLQEASIRPLMSGSDALLLAPTAGGKTEAAVFPLLSRMAFEGWTGISVLYICPLRALLNNLEGRVDTYARWLGRTAGVRSGDTSQASRRRQIVDRPDILLTTPESIESMLVSATIDPRALLGDLRAVVVDEVHAFAGDDRGWHLLAVLERLTELTGRSLQRVGLSATVGNPEELLGWLRGSNSALSASGVVVSPEASGGAATVDVTVDFAGSLANAGTVISRLHTGEKRLVFADSRRSVEELGVHLGQLGVDTYVSHSSLSLPERRRSELAFAQGRDCVIAATSTLELGIDVGDLDRVLQVGSPLTVASFLQRLGRTGRRPGSVRNMTFLGTSDEELLRASGLLLLWSGGFVEPISPTPSPAHIAAQQLVALALQKGAVGRHVWRESLRGLPLADAPALRTITDHLVAMGALDVDSDMLLVGPEADRRYGRRHFMEIMSVFTSDPQVKVLHGRDEVGAVDPLLLVKKVEGPRVIALAGRSWRVTSIDWKRRFAFVEPTDSGGIAKWLGTGRPMSFELTDAVRRILLGASPDGIAWTGRAETRLDELRHELADRVDAHRSVLLHTEDGAHWYTWAGGRANAVLAARLTSCRPGLVSAVAPYDNERISVTAGTPASVISGILNETQPKAWSKVFPEVADRAVTDLKFADLLPSDLARTTLALRMADPIGAEAVAGRLLVERFSAD